MSRMNYTIIKDDIIPGIEKDRYIVSQTGIVWDMKEQKFVTIDWSNNYGRVKLKLENGEVVRVMLHQLVKAAHDGFDPNPARNTINHINFNPRDNYLSNLEWATTRENNFASINAGRYYQFNITLSEDDAEEICKLIKMGYNNVQISDIMFPKFGKPIHKIVARIRRLEEWEHISAKYLPFPDTRPSYIKLNDIDVEHICIMLQQGMRNIDIAKQMVIERPDLDFKMLQAAISNIKNRKRHLDISSKYNF